MPPKKAKRPADAAAAATVGNADPAAAPAAAAPAAAAPEPAAAPADLEAPHEEWPDVEPNADGMYRSRDGKNRLTFTKPTQVSAKVRQSVNHGYVKARTTVLEDWEERKHIKFRRRPVWTSCLVLAWLGVGFVVISTHKAVEMIIPPITTLPANVFEGFNEIFAFGDLEKDGVAVQAEALKAMVTCHAMTDAAAALITQSTCSAAPTGSFVSVDAGTGVVTILKTATQPMITEIEAIFKRSLQKILDITEDKCFSQPAFDETNKGLKEVLAQVANVSAQITGAAGDGGLVPCVGTWPAFCAMHVAGGALAEGAAAVTIQLDEMANGPNVQKFTEYAEKYLPYMHAMPYVLVASLGFFTLFWWWSGGICCCCKKDKSASGHDWGICLGCCCCCMPYLMFWFIYFVIAAAIVAVGWAIPKYSKETDLPFKPTNGTACTISNMMDHVEIVYADFFNLVFKDFIAGCLEFEWASRLALCFCMFIGGYSCCICLCRPYGREYVEDIDGSMPLAKE